MQAGQINETLIGTGGQFSAFIPTGSNTTTLKKGPGRVCKIIVTGAGSASFSIFDNTAASGNVIYTSPATTSIGQILDVQVPAQTGITVVNAASGPAFAVSFN
jgi:hypothetical protein